MSGRAVTGFASKCSPNGTQSVNYGINGSPGDYGKSAHIKSAADSAIKSSSQEDETPYCPPQRGYRVSLLKCLILYPLATLPLGAGLLLAYWFPHVWLRLTSLTTPLSKATHVIVTDSDGKSRVEVVHTVTLPADQYEEELLTLEGTADHSVFTLPEDESFRYITHRHLRYLYNEQEDRFVLLRGFDHGFTCSDIRDMHTGLTDHAQLNRFLHYGPNSVEVPVKPYHSLLISEVLHPFYIFEIITVIFWMVDNYYIYAGAVFVISTISVFISLIQTRRNLQQLHDLITHSCRVTVYRGGREVYNVRSEDLVPGDVLVVPPTGMVMPCDAALISGNAIVNEAMLTGESVPVTKTPLPSDHAHYCPTQHKRHTLFNGTQVIQTRYYGNSKVTAVVVRTGFSTAKGGMVRSILFPKPLNLKFYSDALKFVGFLSILALVGAIYSVIILQVQHYQVKETILRSLDVITIVVPPALPAALTVGTVYALSRLRKQKIFCISPQRVNLCGKIKLVCFDKTGTLTEDSLDMYGVRPAQNGMFSALVEDPCTLTSGPLLFTMATCHSLTLIKGELSGDPLDLKMFKATGWMLEEPGRDDTTRFDTMVPTVVHPQTTPTYGQTTPPNVELGIMRQFTFSSELQRMSVLVRSLPSSTPSQFHAYVKGAPETIRKLCKPSSIPCNFFEELGALTQQGFRVLAVGHKTINMPWHRAERVKRDVIESELHFAGFIVMQNKLKSVTTPTIQALQNADIHTVMITGDNILTAISVAKECKMVSAGSRVVMVRASGSGCGHHSLSYHLMDERDDLLNLLESSENFATDFAGDATPLLPCETLPTNSYHLAVDGRTFAIIRDHFPNTIYPRLLVKGTVFARMSPTQKAQLVSSLMEIGYGVCMCGDGANDCGALKAAHAGISLSETEASVASPFTSKVPDITCVPILIREGRAALVTSFSVFKYMALYSFCEFITAAVLYSYESNLGDWEYLWIDLVLILALSFTMGFTAAYPQLVKKRPLGSLAGIHVLLSLAVHTLLLVAFQLGALYYLKTQHWYSPLKPDPDSDNIACQENTVLFQMSIFQYIGLSIILSTAAPFRKPLFTNIWFMLCLVVLFLCNLYITAAPPHWVPGFWELFQLVPVASWAFRLGLLELALLYTAIGYFIEAYLLPTEWMRVLLRVVRCKRRPRNKYKHIISSIPEVWPPLTFGAGGRTQ